MKLYPAFVAVAVVAGLASGPASLASTAASVPPIDSGALLFFFAGTLIGMPLVLGFQVAVGNDKGLRLGWSLMLVCVAYMGATGLSAAVVAVTRGHAEPHAFLLFIVGIAGLLGLGLVRLIFGGKFRDAVPS